MRFDLPDPVVDTVLLGAPTAGVALTSFNATEKFSDSDHDDSATDYSGAELIVDSVDSIINIGEVVTSGTAGLISTWGDMKYGDEDHDDANDYDGNITNAVLVNSADTTITNAEIVHTGLADLTAFPANTFYLSADSIYDDGEDIIKLEYNGAFGTADGDTIALFGATHYYSDAYLNSSYTDGEVIVTSADANLDNTDTIITSGAVKNASSTLCGAGATNCTYYTTDPPTQCVVDDIDTSGDISDGDVLISDACGTAHGDNYTFSCGPDVECTSVLVALGANDKFIDDNANGEHDSGEIIWVDDGDSILEAGEILFGASTTALTSLSGSVTTFFHDNDAGGDGDYDDGEDIFLLHFAGAANDVVTGDTIRSFDANETFSDADDDGVFSRTAVVAGTPELIANSADADLASGEVVTPGTVDVTAFSLVFNKFSDTNNNSAFDDGE
ncbi:MAG: hypothetical protein HY984_00095, partial [Candidatus Magasanikbacteria bacterium]|nr:hypothetical protein [Candidatus Magasanikbacteria bacterium]